MQKEGCPEVREKVSFLVDLYDTDKLDHNIYKEIIIKHIEDEWQFR